MPVNLDAENNARNGTRYTNDGIVCAASRNGRTTLSAVELRPIQTPTTTPRTTTITVATSTAARVSMVACQSCSGQAMSPRHTAVMSADQRPPMIAAIAVIAAKASHHGELASSDCKGSSAAAVTTSLRPLVTGAKTS